MRWSKTQLASSICATLIWSSVVGAQPHVANDQAQLVHNLRVARKGSKVQLTWTQPPATTGRRSIPDRIAIARVCRTISSEIPIALNPATACAKPLGSIAAHASASPVTNTKFGKSDAEITMRFIDVLPRSLEAADLPQFAVYVVELRDERGRRAGISNQAWTLLTPTPEVKGLHSELDSHGVYLIWEDEIESAPASLQFDYRMYRREKGSSRNVAVSYLRAVVHTRDGDRWSGVDTNIEWEKTYLYWITPVTRVYAPTGQLIGEIVGEDSAPIEVTTHDVFPPAVPQGLLVLPSQVPGKKFVDLIWTPDQEKDLAGYNVYRSQDGAPMARINPALIKMLSFQDADVASGHNYVYSVSAVDLRGNESARSPQSAPIQP